MIDERNKPVCSVGLTVAHGQKQASYVIRSNGFGHEDLLGTGSIGGNWVQHEGTPISG
jgi:hypothetical protein